MCARGVHQKSRTLSFASFAVPGCLFEPSFMRKSFLFLERVTNNYFMRCVSSPRDASWAL